MNKVENPMGYRLGTVSGKSSYHYGFKPDSRVHQPHTYPTRFSNEQISTSWRKPCKESCASATPGSKTGKTLKWFSLETSSPFLLECIYISSVPGIVLAMVFALVVAVLFHTLNFVIHFRERHPTHGKSNLQHCVTTVLHAASAIFAYAMAYCVWTMNVWLFASIVLGSGVGQLVIGPFVSIHLEQKRQLRKDADNEPLCDYLPEQMDSNGVYTTSPRAASRDGNNDRQQRHGSSKLNTSLINLDDFMIHKPEHASQAAEYKPFNCEDADQKSEYDSLNDDFCGDYKLIRCEESSI